MKLKLNHGHSIVIDDEDHERLSKFTWYVFRASDSCYQVARNRSTKEGRGKEYLHAFLIGAPDGAMVIHKNGNPLDFRKKNLAVGSVAEMRALMKKHGTKDFSSKFIGVGWSDSRQNWQVVMRPTPSDKAKWIGSFDDEFEAAKAHDLAAIELRGKEAVLNFPELVKNKTKSSR